MTTEHPAAELRFEPNDLLIFLDETGDETFGDAGNPVFGLGGIAVLGCELVSLVEQPWCAVRSVFGRKPDAPLHANKVERRLNQRKEEAIIRFFKENQMRRLAVIANGGTTYSGATPKDPVIQGITNALLKRIEEIVRWTPAQRIHAIFEHNARLIPRLAQAIGDARFEVDGRELPFDCYVMTKGASLGLEVADFLMHIVAGHVRSGRNPNGKFAKRFDATFTSSSPCLLSFMEIADLHWKKTQIPID